MSGIEGFGHPAGSGVGSTIEHLARHGWYATSTHRMSSAVDRRVWMVSTLRDIRHPEVHPVSVRTMDRSVGVNYSDDRGRWTVHVTVHAVTLTEAFGMLDAECARVDGEMAGDGIGGTA